MKIIETIRALQAHAESARSIGNDAEATAYAEKAAQLMRRSNVTAEQVEATKIAPVVEVSIVAANMCYLSKFTSRKGTRWTAFGVYPLAKALGAKVIHNKKNTIIVATAEISESVQGVIESFVSWMDRQADELGVSARHAFARGIGHAVHERLKETENAPGLVWIGANLARASTHVENMNLTSSRPPRAEGRDYERGRIVGKKAWTPPAALRSVKQ